jgi:hypothetical protein
MPRGPKGERRPADVIGNAVKVMRIATGEEAQELNIENSRASVASKGGQARAKKLTPKRRSEISKQGAAARWPARAVPSEGEES